MANTIRIKKRAASGADGAPSSLASSNSARMSRSEVTTAFGDNGSESNFNHHDEVGAFFTVTVRPQTLSWLVPQLDLTLTRRSGH